MIGYIATKKDFCNHPTSQIVDELSMIYPDAPSEQVASWKTLIDDLHDSSNIANLCNDAVIAIEYSLPTDGMAIDLILTGEDSNSQKIALIIEAKQWNDNYIHNVVFSQYREPGKELNPQIQVSRHRLSFSNYLSIGEFFHSIPIVYLRNASSNGKRVIEDNNPIPQTTKVPIYTDINSLLSYATSIIVSGKNDIINLLSTAVYKPSTPIISAMNSIITHEEPFILTEEQLDVVKKVKNAISTGKKIIRITGAAGSGKTAILLNLYVEYLNLMEKEEVRPIFISGAQNTALYRSLYPNVQNSFTYSFSLDRMVPKTKGNLYYIFMDEAQHNGSGIIPNMINRGATLILCYDTNQAINAGDSDTLFELDQLNTRSDFISINLEKSVRFNGSQVAEENIRNLLNGKTNFIDDDCFDLRLFTDFYDFQNAVFNKIHSNPEATVAVAGLLSKDASNYTFEGNPNSKLFTKWGSKTECEWIPYIQSKNYLAQNEGKLWVGTWWLPGLDVDFIGVIIGGDAVLTPEGLKAVPDEAKHYKMILSVAERLNLPNDLIVTKKSFGKEITDSYKSANNIISYINKPENIDLKDSFLDLFSHYLLNNYYITMTRGQKGCYIYFAKNELGA